ncbi:MAG: hypothetical protein AAF693_20750 [Bacteroidota bacterium]
MKSSCLLVLFFLTVPAQASHLLGGYLTYRWVGGNQYEITVILFTDDNSGVEAGDGILDFGDGTSQIGRFEFEIEKKPTLLT